MAATTKVAELEAQVGPGKKSPMPSMYDNNTPVEFIGVRLLVEMERIPKIWSLSGGAKIEEPTDGPP
jgi:hypothetical protein